MIAVLDYFTIIQLIKTKQSLLFLKINKMHLILKHFRFKTSYFLNYIFILRGAYVFDIFLKYNHLNPWKGYVKLDIGRSLILYLEPKQNSKTTLCDVLWRSSGQYPRSRFLPREMAMKFRLEIVVFGLLLKRRSTLYNS